MTSRAAGILVHPTSLPGPYGAGDLGPGTLRFLDWAAEAGQSVWQLLPLAPTGEGCSPYAALSVHAGNPDLISPERLALAGWIPHDAIEAPSDFSPTQVQFHRLLPWKRDLLRRSWNHFRQHAGRQARRRFDAFVEDDAQAGWLEDWALFAALKERADGRPWPAWEAGLARRESAALGAARLQLADEVAAQRYFQFVFFDQWNALRREAATRGVRLLGDLPFYVAHDSVDVWSRPDLFRLDEHGHPLEVAGVPPDYFSEDGQRWGNPLFRWDAMKHEGYRWWIDRVRSGLRSADLLRLDHFRGFVAFWEVEAGAEVAARGRWVRGPGRPLFDAISEALGGLPFVAEDLGTITEEVIALRRELGLPGMRVLQFGFDGDDDTHAVQNPATDVVAYTGTHDNDTVRGWFDRLEPDVRQRVLAQLRCSARDVDRRAVEALYQSAADVVVVPLQDVFGLGSEARMNFPGTTEGNWRWRASRTAFTLNRARRLRRLAESSGRA